MTQYLRRSEQAHAERFHTSGKAINEKVRLYAAVGKALIAARETANDPYQAIQTVLPWETFVQTVTEADQLTQPPDFDYLDQLDAFYGQIRKYAPAMLDTLQFHGAPVCQSLLRAIHLLKQMNAEDRKKVQPGAPLGFIKSRWEDYVCTAHGIDRHYYELCKLTHDRLRWVNCSLTNQCLANHGLWCKERKGSSRPFLLTE